MCCRESRARPICGRHRTPTWVKGVWPIVPLVYSTAGALPSIASSLTKSPRCLIPRFCTRRIPLPPILHSQANQAKTNQIISSSGCHSYGARIKARNRRTCESYLSPPHRRLPYFEICARSPLAFFSSWYNSSSSARRKRNEQTPPMGLALVTDVVSYIKALHKIFGNSRTCNFWCSKHVRTESGKPGPILETKDKDKRLYCITYIHIFVRAVSIYLRKNKK